MVFEFQSLIGMLKTTNASIAFPLGFKVSIPHRYAENQQGYERHWQFDEFQSLIGMLKTEAEKKQIAWEL